MAVNKIITAVVQLKQSINNSNLIESKTVRFTGNIHLVYGTSAQNIFRPHKNLALFGWGALIIRSVGYFCVILDKICLQGQILVKLQKAKLHRIPLKSETLKVVILKFIFIYYVNSVIL